jgi:hypothetical protein
MLMIQELSKRERLRIMAIKEAEPPARPKD